MKERVALYASTPEYKPMLDMHGWDVDVSDFIELSREGRWADMGELVSDEMLAAYAVVARPEELPSLLQKRYDSHIGRWQLDEEWFDGLSDEETADLIKAIKAL